MPNPVAKATYNLSQRGLDKQEACHREFKEMLLTAAKNAMRRRRSFTLDEADFETSMRELLSSREIDWTRTGIGTALVLVSGIFLNWGAGYFPHCKTWDDAAMGFSICVLGGVFGVTGAFIQFWPNWSK